MHVRYDWLEHRYRSGLIEKVRDAMEEGWEPLGAPFMMKLSRGEASDYQTDRVYIQAVTLEDKDWDIGL